MMDIIFGVLANLNTGIITLQIENHLKKLFIRSSGVGEKGWYV